MIFRIKVTRELQEVTRNKDNFTRHRRQRWHHSILGKVTLFLIVGIIFSYGVGASAGWLLVDKSSQEQWRRQANTNAHIISYIVRSIYTSVMARMNAHGQTTGIVTDSFLGDDAYILQTGFNPVDVLSLAAMQTNNPVWLFHYGRQKGFVSVTDASGADTGQQLTLEAGKPLPPERLNTIFTGFVLIDDKTYFASVLPLLSPSGEMLGALVSSIGEKQDLYRIHNSLLRNSLLGLLAVLLLTGLIVSLLMRQFFHSLPALIQSLTRIARGDTASATPFLERDDEIGGLALAIEKLRQAMVEREHLQQVKETARKMEHMAHHDALTGLPNRTFFSGALEDAIAGLPSGNARFNLMLLDLDYFKQVNDTFGHLAGDALLVGVGERISTLLGGGDIVARLGGDEFALLQRVQEKPIQEATRLAERLIEAIATPFYAHGHEFSVGLSIGIASAPLHGETSHALMTHADLALYAAKNSGRNNYRYFEYGMVMPDAIRSPADLDIEGALMRGEFELHYQPLVRLADNSVVGYEALVRWRRAAGEWLSPDAFIMPAEKTGLIVRLGEWIIHQACSDAMAHFAPHQWVSINISGVQLHHPGLLTILNQALTHSGLSAERLELEITEAALLDRQAALAVLQRIQARGIAIALDDLGASCSSLDCLADFPFSRIKLDKTLIAGLTSSDTRRMIIGNIISLAHLLDMETSAEGVETDQQITLLRQAGCRYVQGGRSGEALSATDIAARKTAVIE
ncbi:EAL domain-containing protein [Affinibrenneria salicis]|uniref:diguanylate cyclase n=1 Tax=Affinibrenneria salicis TaxID=2590031 RepID=A0A5J5FYS6_9GAMM|nr:GGDEF domain-containing phosphodiesterase [Affinibrenneria salicis]KAA8999382.1 EAL domain-containing protein [Affinibrenneria salicis]